MEQDYILTEDSINGIKLNEGIRNEELHEYEIRHRDSFIDKLIRWILEASTCKELMKSDLKELMGWEDEYILSSVKTNSYLGSKSSEFDKTCKELLEIHKSL